MAERRRASIYSLATPLHILPSPTTAKRTNFISKLLQSKPKHKQTVSEDLEWHCKGEDLEDNFDWSPTHSLSLSGELERRLSGHQTLRSVSASDSDLSEIDTPASSRPTSLSYNPKEYIIDLFSTEKESDEEIEFEPIQVTPLKVSRGHQHRATQSCSVADEGSADARRRKAEVAAIDALETFFSSRASIASSSESIRSYNSALTSPLPHISTASLSHLTSLSHYNRSPRPPSLDFSSRSLPPIPSDSALPSSATSEASFVSCCSPTSMLRPLSKQRRPSSMACYPSPPTYSTDAQTPVPAGRPATATGHNETPRKHQRSTLSLSSVRPRYGVVSTARPASSWTANVEHRRSYGFV